jgi:hypothetical protein
LCRCAPQQWPLHAGIAEAALALSHKQYCTVTAQYRCGFCTAQCTNSQQLLLRGWGFWPSLATPPQLLVERRAPAQLRADAESVKWVTAAVPSCTVHETWAARYRSRVLQRPQHHTAYFSSCGLHLSRVGRTIGSLQRMYHQPPALCKMPTHVGRRWSEP